MYPSASLRAWGPVIYLLVSHTDVCNFRIRTIVNLANTVSFYLITRSLIFIIILKNSNKTSSDWRKSSFRQLTTTKQNNYMWIITVTVRHIWVWGRWSEGKSLPGHFMEGGPGVLGNSSCEGYIWQSKKTFILFFSTNSIWYWSHQKFQVQISRAWDHSHFCVKLTWSIYI